MKHDPTCRYVRVDGEDLAYQIYHDAPGKRPLVMLHGYSIRSTGETYQALYEGLAHEFAIYAFDMRGHGGSAALAADFTFAKVADSIHGAVQTLGLKDPIHAGHSFGGFMGLVTELRHPGTFSALCLLAASAASGGVATPEEVKTTITNEGHNPAVMHELYSQMYMGSPGKAAVQPLVDAVGLMDPEVHRAYFYREYPTVILTDRLGEIATPVLHLNGAHDTVVAPAEQHLTARGLPNGKEVIFSNEGHMLPLEAPERTAREITAFVNYDI